MQKVINFLLALSFFTFSTSYTFPPNEKVKWISVADMQKAYKVTPKPILVDLYTDWCGWCKVMDKETYRNPKVVSYINKNYYAIKLNAETQSTFDWDGKTFSYNHQYRVNELAAYLAKGQLSYPTTVLLPAPNAQPSPLAGYIKPSELESPLKYFGDGVYKTKTYNEFLKTFSASW